MRCDGRRVRDYKALGVIHRNKGIVRSRKGERKYGKSTQQGAVVKRVTERAQKYGESTQQGEGVKRGGEAYRKKCSGSVTEVKDTGVYRITAEVQYIKPQKCTEVQ